MAKLELTSWSNKTSWQLIAISRICSCHNWYNTKFSLDLVTPLLVWTAFSWRNVRCDSRRFVTECDLSYPSALLIVNDHPLFTTWAPQLWIHAVLTEGAREVHWEPCPTGWCRSRSPPGSHPRAPPAPMFLACLASSVWRCCCSSQNWCAVNHFLGHNPWI